MIDSTEDQTGRGSLQSRLSNVGPRERAALKALVERLRSHYGDELRRVVLFGSKARSDSDEESDLDVLIVLRMAHDEYRRYWNEVVNIAWDIELANDVVMSLVIKDEADYLRMREHGLLLVRNIERDGIELWTKKPSVRTFESA